MRNLKILGLALVAMLAMSAFGASMASADEFTAEQAKANLSGINSGEDKFVITAGNTSCKEVIYDVGIVSSGVTTVTAAPTYPAKTAKGEQNCLSLGFPANIDTNGCHYLFHVTGGTSTEGDVTVQCPAGQEITVTAIGAGTTKCTIHVPPQTLAGDPVKYANSGAGATRQITISVNTAGLKYTHTAGTGVGACPTGSASNGTFTGAGTVTGNNEANTTHQGLFLSNA